MKKKKYDTSVVMFYLLGKEHLLPDKFRKSIPYSTISTWRKNSLDDYMGSEYRFLFESKWDVIQFKKENKKLRSILQDIIKCYLLFRGEIQQIIQVNKRNKLFQSKVVSAINILKSKIGLPLALKIFSLSKTQYYEWSIIKENNCSHSFSSLCVKRYPRQLHEDEVARIKRLLSSPKYLHWPIVSIAAQGLRKGNVVVSLYTWYKYARLFNIHHEAFQKEKKLKGLIAHKPNEYLHIDTTYYYISEGKKACITFVMDNYSKMILGYAVDERLSFTLIKTAINNALTTIQKNDKGEQSFLVTDGGKENNNKQVEQFISEITGYKLIKIRALKDIQFSNSPIEAVHRIMKGRYIRNRKFETIEGLNNFLNKAVYDYNYLRPHYKHWPKTPSEAYHEVNLKFDVQKRIVKSMNKRVKSNLSTACNVCKANNLINRMSLLSLPNC